MAEATVPAGPPARAPGAAAPPAARQILDAALELGERQGWDAVHLHDITHALGITLAELLHHYPHKDALADAWFDRADAAMLGACEVAGWSALSPRQRLHGALSSWLGALEPHRRLTAQMLRYKLQPDHLHLQAQGALRVSRTVQCWREVAWLPSTGWRREAEEAVLTGIFLSTFALWLRDTSPGSARAQEWLRRRLGGAEWVASQLAFPLP